MTLGDRVRQLRDRLQVAEAAADVDQPVELGVGGGGDARMPVAQHRGRDAAGEVEVGLAVRVVEAVALPVIPGTSGSSAP